MTIKLWSAKVDGKVHSIAELGSIERLCQRLQVAPTRGI